MADFAPTIDVSTMTSDTGVTISGETAGDRFGWSVSGAGDFNHDGWLDLLVGANGVAVNGVRSGAAYVIYGSPDGFTTNLSALNGSNGVQLNGGFATVGDLAGFSVSSLGDVNGDGFDDVLIGAPYNRAGGSSGGAGYVVFGGKLPAVGDFNLSALGNGTYGFKAFAATSNFAGWNVSGAGDFNGDHIADMVIAAPGVSGGFAYLLYGHTGAFADLNLSTAINGTNGFRITGGGAGSNFGNSVAGAGDINGDGYDDLIIGAHTVTTAAGVNAGRSYVLFGHAGPSTTPFNALTLNGSAGFTISGSTANERSGYAVGAAGDINGDGFDDLVVGAYNGGGGKGAAYVVFGHSGAFAANIDVSSLNGANGFAVTGAASGDIAGYRIKAAGDVNGDGYGDLIVGAARVENGATVDAGAAYVVFGKASGFSANIDLGALTGRDGFRILGSGTNAYAGVSVSGVGDLNKDGYDDLIVGASGVGGAGGSAGIGASYIIFGHANSANPITGGAGDETLNGGAGTDGISGGGGKDVVYGFAGADTINGDAANDTLSGGADNDTLHGGSENDIVSGDDGDDDVYGDDGNDKVNGGAGSDHLYGGLGADQLDGGDGVDVLEGNDGNDTLNGGAGADSMTGGTGNDVYYVDDAGDTTVELAGQGTDIVRAATSWTLWDNVEQLELLGAEDLDATGNELSNRLVGNGGANSIWGNAGVDTIDGGAGNDRIIGGTGNDLMTGGLGADTFVVLSESAYSSRAPAGRALEIDFVYDLNKAQGDRLDLSGIDADTATGADDTFHLVGAFTKHAGEMTLAYTLSSNQTVLSLDVDGDGKADYQMKLTGDVHADSGGWLL